MVDAWKQWEGELVDGRFRLTQFLGGSNHSAVFLAECSEPARRAALKFVDANPATAQLQLSRWERAAKLSHPHLLRIYHSGRCQLGRSTMLYVVTEFAQENLAQILPNRPLAPTEAEFMLRSVLEVLAYLHGQGLAHGRLNPGNIMAVNEQLKISGDTICRPGEKRFGQNQPTVYDPPEMTTTGLSPAGDVWSLGITLVEVLTQRASVGDGIRQEDLTLPESLPSPFLEIARQCLRLDPQRRWTVPDIAARLLPVSIVPKKKPWARYGVAGAAAGAVVVAIFAGAKYSNRNSQTETASRAAIEQPARPESPKPGTSAPSGSASTGNGPPKHDENPSTSASGTPTPSGSADPRIRNTPPGRVKGSVVEQVLPPVPRKSRDTISGKVKVAVKVAVDSSGKVVGASLASPGPSRYFAKLALDASRHWRFTPPQVDGEAVASEWILRYQFGRQGTEVFPSQSSP